MYKQNSANLTKGWLGVQSRKVASVYQKVEAFKLGSNISIRVLILTATFEFTAEFFFNVLQILQEYPVQNFKWFDNLKWFIKSFIVVILD